MEIIEACKKDAPLLAEVILEAVGEDITANFAAEKGIDAVKTLFTRLAAREDSQYSYCNALKYIDDDGTPMGFIIGYDGARLHQLRKAFFEELESVFGRKIDGEIPDETVPEEFYLDSLAVFPQYRGKGIARKLIEAMIKRAEQHGKPAGLLCGKTNHRARKLYESIGFRKTGETPFAGVLMDHYQLPSASV